MALWGCTLCLKISVCISDWTTHVFFPSTSILYTTVIDDKRVIGLGILFYHYKDSHFVYWSSCSAWRWNDFELRLLKVKNVDLGLHHYINTDNRLWEIDY